MTDDRGHVPSGINREGKRGEDRVELLISRRKAHFGERRPRGDGIMHGRGRDEKGERGSKRDATGTPLTAFG